MNLIPPADGMSVRDQLERAARDLWSMVHEAGDDYVVFMDHRKLLSRVERRGDETYGVSWEMEDGTWLEGTQTWTNAREAAFHAYQGPH